LGRSAQTCVSPSAAAHQTSSAGAGAKSGTPNFAQVPAQGDQGQSGLFVDSAGLPLIITVSGVERLKPPSVFEVAANPADQDAANARKIIGRARRHATAALRAAVALHRQRSNLGDCALGWPTYPAL